jgi:hypothetical protein
MRRIHRAQPDLCAQIGKIFHLLQVGKGARAAAGSPYRSSKGGQMLGVFAGGRDVYGFLPVVRAEKRKCTSWDGGSPAQMIAHRSTVLLDIRISRASHAVQSVSSNQINAGHISLKKVAR